MPIQNDTKTKRPLDDDEMVDFILKHEKHVPYIYRDHLGNPTVGGGFNISDEKQALKYRFYHMKDDNTFDRPASDGEIKDALKKVKQKPYGQNYGDPFFDPLKTDDLSKIGIPEEESRQKIREKLTDSQKYLKDKIHSFESHPYPAQKALMDMEYNIGNTKFRPTYQDGEGKTVKAWPGLFDALSNQDYVRAAKESHRRGVSVDRNNDIRDLFLKAQEERGLE